MSSTFVSQRKYQFYVLLHGKCTTNYVPSEKANLFMRIATYRKQKSTFFVSKPWEVKLYEDTESEVFPKRVKDSLNHLSLSS